MTSTFSINTLNILILVIFKISNYTYDCAVFEFDFDACFISSNFFFFPLDLPYNFVVVGKITEDISGNRKCSKCPWMWGFMSIWRGDGLCLLVNAPPMVGATDDLSLVFIMNLVGFTELNPWDCGALPKVVDPGVSQQSTPHLVIRFTCFTLHLPASLGSNGFCFQLSDLGSHSWIHQFLQISW